MFGIAMPGQAVHLFRRRAGRWEPDTLLPGPDGEAFALRVAMQVSVLAVSDSWLDLEDAPAGSIREGVVHLYQRRCGGSWVPLETLAPAPDESTSGFGSRVAIDGDRIVVASPSDHNPGSDIEDIDPAPEARTFDDDYRR